MSRSEEVHIFEYFEWWQFSKYAESKHLMSLTSNKLQHTTNPQIPVCFVFRKCDHDERVYEGNKSQYKRNGEQVT